VSANIESLLSTAQHQGIRLWLKDGQLHYRLPKGGSELPVFTEIRQRKHEVLAFLRGRREASLSIPDLQPQPRPLHLPLSFSQRRLWVVEQLGLARAAYNIGSSLRLRGEFDLRAFELSLQEVVRRHESLRTRIETIDGEGYQVIEPPEPLHADLRDLSALEPEAQAREVREIVQAELDRRFVLERAPLFRVAVLRLSAREHVLSFVIHHIITDALSQEILVKELMTLYVAYRSGQHSQLKDLTVQYADFALWQREWLQGETLERLLVYWKEHLAGMAPSLNLPTDRPRPAVANFMRAAYARVRLAPELAKSLAELGRRQGASLYMVLLAGFQTLLSRLSGQKDVAVGSPISGRTDRQTEGLIGFFVNTLVMRTDLSGDPSFIELLERVRTNALNAYVHQDLPFERLVAELQPPRDLSRQPLVQVMFALDNRSEARALELPELVVEDVPTSAATSRFDLLLTLEVSDQGIQGAFEYPVDLFDASTMERYVKWYGMLLEQVVAAPRRALSQLRLLDQAEREELLVRWNRTEQAYSQASVTEMIEQRARACPQAVALVCGDERLTYGELEERSNQLAHYLRRAGVGAEGVVGVCLDRSVEQVISLLAVLKCGGVYLPLEATDPPERLAHALADARVNLVLTRETWLQSLSNPAAKVICLDREDLRQEPRGSLGVSVHPAQLAYVIYVSSPAGQPVGVSATQQNLRCGVAARTGIAPYNTGEVCRYRSPIGFAEAVYEVLVPLSEGAQIIVMTGQPAGDTQEPLANMQAYVLDEHLEPVPVGVPGDLYICGAGLARGYLNKPSQTAQRFLANPYAAGGRMLRTGDRVRHIESGELEYLGRSDSQVRLRGYRIELQEIESCLRSHAGVQDAAVVLHEPVGADAQLVAYYVVQSGAPVPDVSSLKAHLRNKLPAYMVPEHFAELEQLPLSAGGQLDRKALPEPSRTQQSREYVAPRTPTERTLARLWAELLHVERVGIHDNFFELGGDSLVSIQIVERALRSGLRLSLRQTFEHQTIAELALVAGGNESVGTERGFLEEPTPLEPAAPEDDESVAEFPLTARLPGEPVPLTFQQRFRLGQIQKDNGWHNPVIWRALRFHGELDIERLGASLNAIRRRHEALRTRIVPIDGIPHQHIDDSYERNLELISLADEGQEKVEEKALRFARKFIDEPADLAIGPLFRSVLLRLADRDHILVLAFDHIIFDGVSINIFLSDLWILYEGSISSLPEVSIQYGDYAVWQAKTKTQEWWKRHHAPYWQGRLQGAQRIRLPVDVETDGVTPFSGTPWRLSLGRLLTDSLRELARRERTTLARIVLALYGCCVARLGDTKDFVIPFNHMGRLDPKLMHTIGYFPHIMYLRLELSEGDTFLEVLNNINTELSSAYKHDDFGQLVVLMPGLLEGTWFQWEPRASPDNVEWPIKLGSKENPVSAVELQLPPSDHNPDVKMKYDIGVVFEDSAEGLVVDGAYRTDLFTAETMRKFDETLRSLAEIITENPHARVVTN
jgi:non-ribosomal peptide synthetase component F/aryl carrier-like protein